MQISFVMLIFLLFSDQISGRGKSPRGGSASGAFPAPPPPVEESQTVDVILKTIPLICLAMKQDFLVLHHYLGRKDS